MQPNASAAPAAAFSDCENESVCLAAALGIVTPAMMTEHSDRTSPSPVRRPPLSLIAPQLQATVRRSDALAPYPPSACKSAQKSRPENRAACILEKLLELYALTNRIGYGKLYACLL